MRRLFEDLDVSGVFASASGWVPPVDVCETAEAVVVRAELPGMDPSELELSIVGGYLKIAGSKADDAVPGTIGRLCLERSSGQFCRVLRLSPAVNAGAATARLRGGVLTVVIPKLPDRRKVEVSIPITMESTQ